MMCRFQGGTPACGPAPAPAAVLAAAGGAPPLPPAPPDCALAPVLAGLVGQQVAVLADGRIACGKLIATDPITLVSPEGHVTVLAGPATSVQF
ncbi:MAG TPA: hypothetical protein VNT75_14905 [Symbiobacteriaceae bacterium]|nr:hypothetical protein [Symbiobacteriaceae bacterium]